MKKTRRNILFMIGCLGNLNAMSINEMPLLDELIYCFLAPLTSVRFSSFNKKKRIYIYIYIYIYTLKLKRMHIYITVKLND